jgi:four helix bundle protein
MAKGDDLAARLVAFAVAVLDLCDKLPKTPQGTHIAGQLLRSGTSGAPNYGEARAAESLSEFIHKLGIVLKELNESNVWLSMIQKRSFVSEEVVAPVLDECIALSKIIVVSRRTAAENAGRIRQGSPSKR